MTNNPWISHTPGDPMPVDGECVVEIEIGRGKYKITDKRKAGAVNWADNTSVVAYRIHKPEQQKEKEVTYKKGDTVTFQKVLTASEAELLNHDSSLALLCKDISHREPAPEPIVGYVDYDPHEPNGLKYVAALETDRMLHGQTRIRITYSPATKEVKAEIVE